MQKGRSTSKRPTSYDVANLAGVSQATVSLVLTGKGARVGISAETEKKVLEAAQALSYYPNTLIRSLQQRRTGIIGLYARDHNWGTRNNYWSEVMAAFHAGVARSGQELLVFSDIPDRPLPILLERMLGGIVDGLVVQPGGDVELLAALVRASIPLVCIGDLVEPIARVCLDNKDATEKLVRHLAEQGYKSVAMLNYMDSKAGTALQRQEAFLCASREAGVLAEANPLFDFPGSFEEAVRMITKASPKIDALVCFNDEMAYGFLKQALEMGYTVPKDLAIVGFDGLPVPLVTQQLTTIKNPITEMCDHALSQLGRIMQGEKIDSCMRMKGQLIVGTTT